MLYKVEYPETFNDDSNVVSPFNVLLPETVKLPILNIVRDVKSFIANVVTLDKLFKFTSLLVIAIFIAVISIGAGGEPPPPPPPPVKAL